MARRLTPYETRIAADMEATLLRLGKSLAPLIEDLRGTHPHARRATVVAWMKTDAPVAALVLDELAGFLGDLVSAAGRE